MPVSENASDVVVGCISAPFPLLILKNAVSIYCIMQYSQGMAKASPTQTSYAVLGLLSLRPWTAYELARQSERSLRWFFPRAERAVYLEAKRLVDLGWARSTKAATGRRTSTVYRITRAGRTALHRWLAAPSTPTQVESEAALKVFFADQAGTAEVRHTIDGIGTDAAHALEQLAMMASGASEFPARAHTNVLSMRLITDIHATLYRWSEWAAGAVETLSGDDQEAIAALTEQTLLSIQASARQAAR